MKSSLTFKEGFHKCFYAFCRAVITPYFYLFKHYRWKVYKPASRNYLVLTNHNTNYDFFLFGLSFRKHMYYVASEAILRAGFGGKCVKALADPIPRKKGASGRDASKMIVERLRKGFNVCMMVEGNRSFSGETGWISDANGPLVKESGAGLITYLVHGAYFVNPRWSHKQRSGRMWGEVVHEYTPEEIAQMTPEEVTEIIRRDIYLNAYDDQQKFNYKYRNDALAEHLETALFMCPDCKKASTLRSKGNRFYCTDCGMDLEFNEYGYFRSNTEKASPFKTIIDWSKWETGYLKEYLKQFDSLDGKCGGRPDELIFSDEGISLYEVKADKSSELLVKGEIALYPDRLVFRKPGQPCDTEYVYGIKEIRYMSIFVADRIMFTAGDKYYETRSDKPFSALKYLISWRFLDGKEYL